MQSQDYYFRVNYAGKTFYDAKTNKCVAKAKIDKKIIQDIKILQNHPPIDGFVINESTYTEFLKKASDIRMENFRKREIEKHKYREEQFRDSVEEKKAQERREKVRVEHEEFMKKHDEDMDNRAKSHEEFMRKMRRESEDRAKAEELRRQKKEDEDRINVEKLKQKKAEAERKQAEERRKKEPEIVFPSLEKLNISSRESWRKWIKLNHPDKKPGNDNLCGHVMTQGRNRGW